MATLLTNEQNYKDIAAAIREKNGTTDTYKPAEMANAIKAIETGGGGELPEEVFTLTGNCSSRFANNGWNWFINEYGNKIKTENIRQLANMFEYSDILTHIPFDINCSANDKSMEGMYRECQALTSMPSGNYGKVNNMAYLFYNCWALSEIPDNLEESIDWTTMESLTSAYQGNMSNMFNQCRTLKHIPVNIFKHANPYAAYSYQYTYNLANICVRLQELRDMPMPYKETTTNALYSTFNYTCSMNAITFETDNGAPIAKKWKSQTIDLITGVGWCPNEAYANMGKLTEETRIVDDATYQALKENEDRWTTMREYSRYNHNSAVETINSLPDTSAYLATAGGTNTIKFNGICGLYTDGGAINTLTEEEIAVAAAKGWTVSIA